MCGILGWMKLNPDNKQFFSPEKVSEAIKETTNRGHDAVGFFSPTLGVRKFPVSGHQLVYQNKSVVEEIAKQPIVIGHTRAATSGRGNSPAPAANNDNNHPHEGKRWVIVHNGYFGRVPEINGYKYNGSCDTELFVAFLETYGLEKSLKMMVDTDSFALVIYDKLENQLYLYRHKNPLCFAWEYETESLIWGSVADIVRKFAGDDYEIRGIRDNSITPVWGCIEHKLYTVSTGKDGLKLSDVNTINPCYSEESRWNQFKKELELTDCEAPEPPKVYHTKETEMYRLPFRDRVEAQVKRNVFVRAGLVDSTKGTMVKLFTPFFFVDNNAAHVM